VKGVSGVSYGSSVRYLGLNHLNFHSQSVFFLNRQKKFNTNSVNNTSCPNSLLISYKATSLQFSTWPIKESLSHYLIWYNRSSTILSKRTSSIYDSLRQRFNFEFVPSQCRY